MKKNNFVKNLSDAMQRELEELGKDLRTYENVREYVNTDVLRAKIRARTKELVKSLKETKFNLEIRLNDKAKRALEAIQKEDPTATQGVRYN